MSKLRFHFITTLAQLFQKPIAVMSEIFDLAVLEIELAKISLTRIIILAILLLLFISTTWVILMALLVFLLLQIHLYIIFSLLVVIFINLILGGVSILAIIKYSHNLTLHATRKQLHLD